MKHLYTIIENTETKSNCLLVAISFWIKDPINTKLIFIPPSNMFDFHIMWTDGINDYDFSDSESTDRTNLMDYLYFEGSIRRFPLGFANRYKIYRKKMRNI